MRRRILSVLGVLLLVLLAVAPAAAQTRSVFWRRWDVTIDNVNTATNSFDVTEDYDISFTGSFRFGTAVIPYANLEDLRNLRVYEAGQPLQAGCSDLPGTFCAQRTDAGLSVVYYFDQPISNSSQTFTIKYTVIGALRVYSGGDQLSWQAVPEDHSGFPIGSSTITVNLPNGFAPREGIDPVEVDGTPGTVQVHGTTVTATTTQRIEGNGTFGIRVQYPHDPQARVPSWQAAFDQQRNFEDTTKPWIDLGSIALSLVIALGGVLGVYLLWYNRGRDPNVGPVPEFLSEPPSNLPPAIVGTLIDERADLRDILSTIIDLAHRGYLVIEEEQKQGFMGIGQHSEFTFKRTDKSLDDLRGYEKRIVADIFGSGMERSLNALRNVFYQYIPQLQGDLYRELLTEGLFKSNPNTTRSVWSGAGIVIVVLAVLLGVGISTIAETTSASLLCIPFALGFIGIIVSFVGQAMPAKTDKGAEEAAKWHSFLRYLHNLEKYKTVEEAAAHFDDYLPYAVAFGMDRTWVQRFSKVSNVPAPPWYYPTYLGRRYVPGTPIYGGGFPSQGNMMPGQVVRAGGSVSLDQMAGNMSHGLESISMGITAMLNSAASTFSSRPQSSGGTGRWSSGGRSWSGGGFHGGGHSGGGSRGFG
jgi:uncharacterized membrane protein